MLAGVQIRSSWERLDPLIQQIVENKVVASSRRRSITGLAQGFEPGEQTIRNCVFQADRDKGKRADILNTPEREELRRLREENRRLGQERLAR